MVTKEDDSCPEWAAREGNGHEKKGYVPVRIAEPEERSRKRMIRARNGRRERETVTKGRDMCPYGSLGRKNSHERG